MGEEAAVLAAVCKTKLEEEEEEEEEGMKFLFPFYCFGVDSLFICICGPSNFSELLLKGIVLKNISKMVNFLFLLFQLFLTYRSGIFYL